MFIKSLDRAWEHGKSTGNYPRWVVVPDTPFNAEATTKEWKEWEPIIKSYGFHTAFAVQDGHALQDVPNGADVVFVGGTTEWKRASIGVFCKHFPRVHVARINTGRWLWVCHYAGAESIDGTGWIWKQKPEYGQLLEYLEIANGGEARKNTLFPLHNFTNYQGIKGSEKIA